METTTAFVDNVHPPSVVQFDNDQRSTSPIPENYSPLSSPPNSPYRHSHQLSPCGGNNNSGRGGIRDPTLLNSPANANSNNNGLLSSQWSASSDGACPSFDKAEALVGSSPSSSHRVGGEAPFDEPERLRPEVKEVHGEGPGAFLPPGGMSSCVQKLLKHKQEHENEEDERIAIHKQQHHNAVDKEARFPLDEQGAMGPEEAELEIPDLGMAPTDEVVDDGLHGNNVSKKKSNLNNSPQPPANRNYSFLRSPSNNDSSVDGHDDGPDDEKKNGDRDRETALSIPTIIGASPAQSTSKSVSPPWQRRRRSPTGGGIVAAAAARIENMRRQSSEQQLLELSPAVAADADADADTPRHNSRVAAVVDEPFDEKEDMADESSIDRPPMPVPRLDHQNPSPPPPALPRELPTHAVVSQQQLPPSESKSGVMIVNGPKSNGSGEATDDNDIPMIQVQRPTTTDSNNNNNKICSSSSSSSSFINNNNTTCNGTVATTTSHTVTSANSAAVIGPAVAISTVPAAAIITAFGGHSSPSTSAAIISTPSPEEIEDPSAESGKDRPELSQRHSFEKDDECVWMKIDEGSSNNNNNNTTNVNEPSSSCAVEVQTSEEEEEEPVQIKIISSIEQRRKQQAMATASVPLSSPPELERESPSPPIVQDAAKPKQQSEGNNKFCSLRPRLDPPSSAPVYGGGASPSSFVRRLSFANGEEEDTRPSPFEAMVEKVIGVPATHHQEGIDPSATPKKRKQEDAPSESSFVDKDGDGQPSESTGALIESYETMAYDIGSKQQLNRTSICSSSIDGSSIPGNISFDDAYHQHHQKQTQHQPHHRLRKLTNGSEASPDSTSQGYPVLVKLLDNDIGVPKGDIMLSLLSNRSNSVPKDKEESNDNSGSNQSRCMVARHAVHEAIWRCRQMRRNCDTKWLRDKANRKPGAPSKGRTSICIDVDETRVSGGALNSLLGTQRAALEHLKYDDFEEALILFGDVLEGYENFFESEQHRQQNEKDIKGLQRYMGVSLHNIGVIQLLRGEFELAYTHFERASKLGAGHSEHLSSLIKMSICRYALKDFPSAHAGFEEALTLARGSLNPNSLADHRQMAEILNNLACLSYMCGQTGKAMKLLKSSLKYQSFAAEKSLYAGSRFSGHTATINKSVTKANIGVVGLVENDLSMSVSALEAALRDQELLLRDAHGTLISTMEYLVVANLMSGQKSKALQLLNRMLHMQADAFGSNDPRFVATEKKIQAIRSDIEQNGAAASLDESLIQSIAPFDGNKPGKPHNRIFRPFKKSTSRKK